MVNGRKSLKIDDVTIPSEWPYSIACAIFGISKEMVNDYSFPEDLELSIEHVFRMIESDTSKPIPNLSRNIQILRLYFKEGYTLNKIANTYGISTIRVRQIIVRWLRILRHPSKAKYIKYGISAIDKKEETCKEN